MKPRLHPQYILGFVDGEGSFHIAIYKDLRMKTGLKIIPEFHISQRYSSKIVLESIKIYFCCGYIKANHAKNKDDDTFIFVVRNREDLIKKVIPFFEKNKLATEKKNDFILFSRIVKMMLNKQHLNKTGVKKILNLAYKMNAQGKYRRRIHNIN